MGERDPFILQFGYKNTANVCSPSRVSRECFMYMNKQLYYGTEQINMKIHFVKCGALLYVIRDKKCD